jgi:ABC-type amino acid transport substrate-binding protein
MSFRANCPTHGLSATAPPFLRRNAMPRMPHPICRVLWFCLALPAIAAAAPAAGDLPEILKRGELRHIGVPYAKFVTGSGDGFSCDLIREFAQELGVRYVYVRSSWKTVINDLIGQGFTVNGDEIVITGETPVTGDLIASGLTILPWRQKLLDYSRPTFPSGVWLIARADSALQPITPSGDLRLDIAQVKALLEGRSVLCMPGTCLDPALYGLNDTGATLVPLPLKMNEFAPAVINGSAETSLLDVADSLIAMEKWPGKIKVVGPISELQSMGVGFPKTSPRLLSRFNTFLDRIQKDGTYMQLVEKYYPGVEVYFPEFFNFDGPVKSRKPDGFEKSSRSRRANFSGVRRIYYAAETSRCSATRKLGFFWNCQF